MKLCEMKSFYLTDSIHNVHLAIGISFTGVGCSAVLKFDSLIHDSIPVCYHKVFYHFAIETYKRRYRIGSEL